MIYNKSTKTAHTCSSPPESMGKIVYGEKTFHTSLSILFEYHVDLMEFYKRQKDRGEVEGKQQQYTA